MHSFLAIEQHVVRAPGAGAGGRRVEKLADLANEGSPDELQRVERAGARGAS
jgi:hypothetical protein